MPPSGLDREGLDRSTRILASIHALTVLGNESELRKYIGIGLAEGLKPNQLSETLLQSVLFAGIPRAINAFAVLREELSSRGIGDRSVTSAPAIPPSPEESAQWANRGRELFEAIYPRNHAQVANDLLRGHPELMRNVIFGAYGGVLARDVLAPRERELLAVAALVVLRTPRQLVAHIRGARYVGARLDEIREVISQMALHVDASVVDRSLLYLERIKREF
ncbi:MAG: carboxymuconolactone decarboxylase family protein [Planctomycetes bacterium]|nr:carboxymuconolactone decarboxylase family protein [Planctomycetota bacterium]MBI3847497.1 carboxymuconolactone decarboxylase family protein [Planctomycetota bacterium]